MSNTNEITGKIIEAGLSVHKALGAGLLEKVYQDCLAYELKLRNMNVLSEQAVPLKYKGIEFDTGFRLDLLVEDSIVIEVKAALDLNPVHKSQILTYVKLLNAKVGLLLNFNVPLFKDGIYRVIN